MKVEIEVTAYHQAVLKAAYKQNSDTELTEITQELVQSIWQDMISDSFDDLFGDMREWVNEQLDELGERSPDYFEEPR